jgi:hypothetical protein
MSRLNPPPFSRRPLRPGKLKRAVLEIAALETGRPSVPRQQFGMPVDNGGGAIVITDPSSPDPPAYATGNGASVRVRADAVGSKIRGVPGFPQHSTEGARVANAPASKKPKPVYTTIARYVTGEKARYDPEDIQYRIFEHAREYMYKSLQHYIPGDPKDPTDLHIWKLESENLEDDGVTTVKIYRCPFKFDLCCSAGIMVKEGQDYILIARCGTHTKKSHNREIQGIFLNFRLHLRNRLNESRLFSYFFVCSFGIV